MAELIVSEFVTLDGVMEAPGGEPTHPHTGWTMEFATDEQQQYKFDEIVAAESHLLGRVTYESFAGAWPTYEGPFADGWRSHGRFTHAPGWSCRPRWRVSDHLGRHVTFATGGPYGGAGWVSTSAAFVAPFMTLPAPA